MPKSRNTRKNKRDVSKRKLAVIKSQKSLAPDRIPINQECVAMVDIDFSPYPNAKKHESIVYAVDAFIENRSPFIAFKMDDGRILEISWAKRVYSKDDLLSFIPHVIMPTYGANKVNLFIPDGE